MLQREMAGPLPSFRDCLCFLKWSTRLKKQPRARGRGDCLLALQGMSDSVEDRDPTEGFVEEE